MDNKMHTDLLNAKRICKEAAVHSTEAARLYGEAEALTPVLKRKKMKNIFLGIGSAYLLSMVAMLPAGIPHVGPFLSMLLNFAGMAAGVYLGVTLHRRDKAALEAKISKLSCQAAAEEAAAQKIYDDNEQQLSFLPGEYWHPDAISYMIRVLQSGRTQDLAAAMDMYDNYRHRCNIEETNRRILLEQQTQSSHLKSIKTSSKVSAAANTANTIFNIASKL